MDKQLRFYTLGILIFWLVACGRNDGNPAGGGQSAQLRTVTEPLVDIPEIPTYVPERSGSVITVDLSIPRPIDSIEMTLDETIMFTNPPVQTNASGWYIEFEPSAFKKFSNMIEQPYMRDVSEVYPLDGWMFKLQKSGVFIISLYNQKDCGSAQCSADTWGSSYKIRVK